MTSMITSPVSHIQFFTQLEGTVNRFDQKESEVPAHDGICIQGHESYETTVLETFLLELHGRPVKNPGLFAGHQVVASHAWWWQVFS